MTKVVRRPLASRLFDWSSRRLGYGNEDPTTNGEFRLLAELPERPTVFDVGANRGDFAQGVLERIPGARIHCFEPSPSAYETLNTRLRDRAVLHNVALDSAPGQAVLYANEPGSELSSLYRRDLRALGMPFGQHTESVTVSTLDIEAGRAGVDRWRCGAGRRRW